MLQGSSYPIRGRGLEIAMSQTAPTWTPAATKATFLLAVAIGTGGLSTTELYARKSTALREGTAPVQPQPKLEAAAISSIEKERLSAIRRLLRIGVGDVGKMFGVSRQSVYDWLGGKQPSTERADRIFELTNALFDRRIDLESTQGRVGTRVLEAGETFVEMIARGVNAEEAVQQLVSVFSTDRTDMFALSNRLRERRQNDHGTNDYESEG